MKLIPALKRFNSPGKGELITNAVSLVLWLTFVLSVGPALQYYITSLLNSDAASIYGTAYQDSLIRFPSLGDWLLQGLDWKFIGMACAIAFFSLRSAQPRQIFGLTTASTALVLTLFDFAYLFWTAQLTAKAVVTNVIANSVGGLAVGLLLICLYAVCELLIRYAAVARPYRAGVAGILIAGTGVLTSILSYYALDLLYRPVPVSLNVRIATPGAGTLVYDPSLRPERKPFHLVSEANARRARWLAPSGNLKATWRAAGQPASLSLELFSDCLPDRDLPTNDGRLVIEQVRSFSVAFSSGYSELTTLSKRGIDGLSLDPGEVSQFKFEKAADGETTIRQFVDDTARLKFRGSENAHEFYLVAISGVPDEAEHRNSGEYRLRISSDRGNFSFDLKGRKKSPKEKLDCAPLNLRDWVKQKPGIKDVSTMTGLKVKIDPPSTLDTKGSGNGEVVVEGSGGWVSVFAMNEQAEFSDAEPSVPFLVFHGNASDLEIDGKPHQLRGFENYAAFGDLVGRTEDTGLVQFSGKAWAVWREETRMNPTKWEKLDHASRGVIAAWALSIWGALFSIGAKRAYPNRSFVFLRSRRKA
jgi:hypothetical protein